MKNFLDKIIGALVLFGGTWFVVSGVLDMTHSLVWTVVLGLGFFAGFIWIGFQASMEGYARAKEEFEHEVSRSLR